MISRIRLVTPALTGSANSTDRTARRPPPPAPFVDAYGGDISTIDQICLREEGDSPLALAIRALIPQERDSDVGAFH